MTEPALTPRRPGGQMTSRPLHFFWLADASGSMRVDGKIQALNNAVREAIPHMQTVARENPHAAVFVRAMRFAEKAEWLDEGPTPVADYRWQDLDAGGATSLGEALIRVSEVLQSSDMDERALPPVIALITDGLPTDDLQLGLQRLMAEPWGRQALRVVVAIGEDAASTEAQEVFRAFVANDSLRPFLASNPEALVEHIRWISTAVLKSVSSPASQGGPGGFSGSTPAGPAPHTGVGHADVW